MTLNDTSEYTSPCVSMVFLFSPWVWPDRGDLSDVRLVTKEVPVVLQAIHDNIVEVPQVEYIEVVKEIPKVEVRYVEKTVEVPKIEYATWRNGVFFEPEIAWKSWIE